LPAPQEELPFGAGITPLETEDNVEVGEAPEEVPDEPGAAEQPPPRRRRGRRRGRRGAEPQIGPEPASAPSDVPGEQLATEEPQAPEMEGEEVEEDEEEPAVSFADWTVPSWQELIASLYRPER
jgi:hypothetical protein